MIRAYHVIFTAYGFWLPNDPRGSWSELVRQWELYGFGPATKVHTHQSVAHRPHNPTARERPKQALQHEPVHFTGPQAREIARGFGSVVARCGYVVYAAAILPQHVHMVIARSGVRAEQMLRRFKQAATQQLRQAGLDPMDGLASPWARDCWKVFLDDAASVRQAIRYVEANPEREGKPMQRWSFVTPFEG
jgi:REP element-mobilizing transposase RayT